MKDDFPRAPPRENWGLDGGRPAPADYARLKAELDLAIAIVRSLEHLRDLKRRR